MNAGLLKAWGIWDFFYQHTTRLEYVDKKNGNIFRVVFCKYHGSKLTTIDGVEILKGDRIVKLHIYNYRLTKMLRGIDNEARLGLTTLKIVKNSMPKLAEYIENHPNSDRIKGIIGTTFLHRGVVRLGFDVAPIEYNLKLRIKTLYLKLLLYFIHPNGKIRIKTRPEELVLKRVFISKNNLINKYARENMEDEM